MKVRNVIYHPGLYKKLEARFIDFKKLFQRKLAQLDLAEINKIIERVHKFADPQINYAGKLGQQMALQSTKLVTKKMVRSLYHMLQQECITTVLLTKVKENQKKESLVQIRVQMLSK